MDILCCALALLGSVVGAGFASGREIVRFFAAHGAMGFIAVAFALAALLALFLHWMTKSLVLPSAVFCVLEGGLAAVYFLKPAWLEGLFPKLLNSLALFGRFDNFVNGLFDISSLVYFVSVALLFVFFTCQGFEKRRWS